MTRRPLILVPGRFSASASALRYAAVVTARALAEAVYAAGGEPLTVLPADDLPARFPFVDGVLLPGGGDLSPATYGEPVRSDEVYDVDDRQDAADLAVARWAADLAVARWAAGRDVPLLAICRGMQVLNVALGGTLDQHMLEPHRHTERPLRIGGRLADRLGTTRVDISCFHHQRIARLAGALRVVATASDGTIEAVELAGRDGFGLGVQWHPEDTAARDDANAALFAAFVEAARVPRDTS